MLLAAPPQLGVRRSADQQQVEEGHWLELAVLRTQDEHLPRKRLNLDQAHGHPFRWIQPRACHQDSVEGSDQLT